MTHSGCVVHNMTTLETQHMSTSSVLLLYKYKACHSLRHGQPLCFTCSQVLNRNQMKANNTKIFIISNCCLTSPAPFPDLVFGLQYADAMFGWELLIDDLHGLIKQPPGSGSIHGIRTPGLLRRIWVDVDDVREDEWEA